MHNLKYILSKIIHEQNKIYPIVPFIQWFVLIQKIIWFRDEYSGQLKKNGKEGVTIKSEQRFPPGERRKDWFKGAEGGISRVTALLYSSPERQANVHLAIIY